MHIPLVLFGAAQSSGRILLSQRLKHPKCRLMLVSNYYIIFHNYECLSQGTIAQVARLAPYSKHYCPITLCMLHPRAASALIDLIQPYDTSEQGEKLDWAKHIEFPSGVTRLA
jgi:hypothetical protein